MQNAKDSFYEVLRGRLLSLNPDRTVVVRGVTRPALVVDENETQSVAPLPDCFHLRWDAISNIREGSLPLVAMRCEIRYGTAGSPWNGGMDRGRVLAAMDAELFTALGQQPRNAPKWNYSALRSGGSAVAMETRLWWSDVQFGEARSDADRLQRTATVQVMSLEEAGEL